MSRKGKVVAGDEPSTSNISIDTETPTQILPSSKPRLSVPLKPEKEHAESLEDVPTMRMLSATASSLSDVKPVSQTAKPALAPRKAEMAPALRKKGTTKAISKKETALARELRERCRLLCLSTFFNERSSVRTLGFTSSISGEGKSFLAAIAAGVLADDANNPVTLLECNWEHPCLHERFGLAPVPGLAEWLRGECRENDVRYKVSDNLTVIPAGNGRRDSVKLLQQIRRTGLLAMSSRSNELFIVDLPPVVSSAYGALAASIVESLIIVACAGVTTDLMMTETTAQLKDLPVQGIILNQVESRIPRWIRQLL